ncbi:MAG: siderophore-interacting protein [Actinomycetota bacterium]
MGAGRVIRQNTRKNEGTVTAISDVGDGLRRVSFRPRDADLRWKPGMAVAVVVDPDGASMKDRWRHYTIRRQAADGQLEFLLTLHDAGGPGRDWIDELDTGSTFTFMGPGGSPVLAGGHPHYVLVGDRTSLASVGAMVDAVPDTTPITAIVATPDPSRAVLDCERAVDLRWVRADDAESTRTGLTAALAELGDLPGDTQAYVTGELHAMRQVRAALGDRGVGRRRVGSHAHWTPDRRGM